MSRTTVNVINGSEAEARMSSVERVIEYSKLPEERPLEIADKKPPPSWPAKGAISFRGVVLRYRPNLPPALNVRVSANCRPIRLFDVDGA